MAALPTPHGEVPGRFDLEQRSYAAVQEGICGLDKYGVTWMTLRRDLRHASAVTANSMFRLSLQKNLWVCPLWDDTNHSLSSEQRLPEGLSSGTVFATTAVNDDWEVSLPDYRQVCFSRPARVYLLIPSNTNVPRWVLDSFRQLPLEEASLEVVWLLPFHIRVIALMTGRLAACLSARLHVWERREVCLPGRVYSFGGPQGRQMLFDYTYIFAWKPLTEDPSDQLLENAEAPAGQPFPQPTEPPDQPAATATAIRLSQVLPLQSTTNPDPVPDPKSAAEAAVQPQGRPPQPARDSLVSEEAARAVPSTSCPAAPRVTYGVHSSAAARSGTADNARRSVLSKAIVEAVLQGDLGALQRACVEYQQLQQLSAVRPTHGPDARGYRADSLTRPSRATTPADARQSGYAAGGGYHLPSCSGAGSRRTLRSPGGGAAGGVCNGASSSRSSGGGGLCDTSGRGDQKLWWSPRPSSAQLAVEGRQQLPLRPSFLLANGQPLTSVAAAQRSNPELVAYLVSQGAELDMQALRFLLLNNSSLPSAGYRDVQHFVLSYIVHQRNPISSTIAIAVCLERIVRGNSARYPVFTEFAVRLRALALLLVDQLRFLRLRLGEGDHADHEDVSAVRLPDAPTAAADEGNDGGGNGDGGGDERFPDGNGGFAGLDLQPRPDAAGADKEGGPGAAPGVASVATLLKGAGDSGPRGEGSGVVASANDQAAGEGDTYGSATQPGGVNNAALPSFFGRGSATSRRSHASSGMAAAANAGGAGGLYTAPLGRSKHKPMPTVGDILAPEGTVSTINDASPLRMAFEGEYSDFISTTVVQEYLAYCWRGVSYTSNCLYKAPASLEDQDVDTPLESLWTCDDPPMHPADNRLALILVGSTGFTGGLGVKPFEFLSCLVHLLIAPRAFFDSPRGRCAFRFQWDAVIVYLFHATTFKRHGPTFTVEHWLLFFCVTGLVVDRIMEFRYLYRSRGVKFFFNGIMVVDTIVVVMLLATSCCKVALVIVGPTNRNFETLSHALTLISSAAAIFVWTRLVQFLLPVFSFVGVLMMTITSIFVLMVKFLVIAVMFTLGVAFAIFIAFKDRGIEDLGSFVDILELLFRTFLGETSFAVFAKEKDYAYSVYGKIILTIYTLLSGVLMSNLLIAMFNFRYNPMKDGRVAKLQMAEVLMRYDFMVKHHHLGAPFTIPLLIIYAVLPSGRRYMTDNRWLQKVGLMPLDGYLMPDRCRMDVQLPTGSRELPYVIFLLCGYPLLVIATGLVSLALAPYSLLFFICSGYRRFLLLSKAPPNSSTTTADPDDVEAAGGLLQPSHAASLATSEAGDGYGISQSSRNDAGNGGSRHAGSSVVVSVRNADAEGGGRRSQHGGGYGAAAAGSEVRGPTCGLSGCLLAPHGVMGDHAPMASHVLPVSPEPANSSPKNAATAATAAPARSSRFAAEAGVVGSAAAISQQPRQHSGLSLAASAYAHYRGTNTRRLEFLRLQNLHMVDVWAQDVEAGGDPFNPAGPEVRPEGRDVLFGSAQALGATWEAEEGSGLENTAQRVRQLTVSILQTVVHVLLLAPILLVFGTLIYVLFLVIFVLLVWLGLYQWLYRVPVHSYFVLYGWIAGWYGSAYNQTYLQRLFRRLRALKRCWRWTSCCRIAGNQPSPGSDSDAGSKRPSHGQLHHHHHQVLTPTDKWVRVRQSRLRHGGQVLSPVMVSEAMIQAGFGAQHVAAAVQGAWATSSEDEDAGAIWAAEAQFLPTEGDAAAAAVAAATAVSAGAPAATGKTAMKSKLRQLYSRMRGVLGGGSPGDAAGRGGVDDASSNDDDDVGPKMRVKTLLHGILERAQDGFVHKLALPHLPAAAGNAAPSGAANRMQSGLSVAAGLASMVHSMASGPEGDRLGPTLAFLEARNGASAAAALPSTGDPNSGPSHQEMLARVLAALLANPGTPTGSLTVAQTSFTNGPGGATAASPKEAAPAGALAGAITRYSVSPGVAPAAAAAAAGSLTAAGTTANEGPTAIRAPQAEHGHGHGSWQKLLWNDAMAGLTVAEQLGVPQMLEGDLQDALSRRNDSWLDEALTVTKAPLNTELMQLVTPAQQAAGAVAAADASSPAGQPAAAPTFGVSVSTAASSSLPAVPATATPAEQPQAMGSAAALTAAAPAALAAAPTGCPPTTNNGMMATSGFPASKTPAPAAGPAPAAASLSVSPPGGPPAASTAAQTQPPPGSSRATSGSGCSATAVVSEPPKRPHGPHGRWKALWQDSQVGLEVAEQLGVPELLEGYVQQAVDEHHQPMLADALEAVQEGGLLLQQVTGYAADAAGTGAGQAQPQEPANGSLAPPAGAIVDASGSWAATVGPHEEDEQQKEGLRGHDIHCQILTGAKLGGEGLGYSQGGQADASATAASVPTPTVSPIPDAAS